MLEPKQSKNVAQVLHKNRVKFPKEIFAVVLSTNIITLRSKGGPRKGTNMTNIARHGDFAFKMMEGSHPRCALRCMMLYNRRSK